MISPLPQCGIAALALVLSLAAAWLLWTAVSHCPPSIVIGDALRLAGCAE